MADNQLAKSEIGIVMPVVDAKGAIAAWKEYQALKTAILDPVVDIQMIKGQPFKKKSYWRKVGTFFNLTTDIVEEKTEQRGADITYHFVVKATANNGRYAIGTGSCNVFEKNEKNTIHNTRATAETRATNRAISNLVGGGEVSAEEVDQELRGIATTTNTLVEVAKEPTMTEFQQNKIYELGKEMGKNKKQTDEYVKEMFNKDWPSMDKVLLKDASRIRKDMGALLKETPKETATQDVDADWISEKMDAEKGDEE